MEAEAVARQAVAVDYQIGRQGDAVHAVHRLNAAEAEHPPGELAVYSLVHMTAYIKYVVVFLQRSFDLAAALLIHGAALPHNGLAVDALIRLMADDEYGQTALGAVGKLPVEPRYLIVIDLIGIPPVLALVADNDEFIAVYHIAVIGLVKLGAEILIVHPDEAIPRLLIGHAEILGVADIVVAHGDYRILRLAALGEDPEKVFDRGVVAVIGKIARHNDCVRRHGAAVHIEERALEQVFAARQAGVDMSVGDDRGVEPDIVALGRIIKAREHGHNDRDKECGESGEKLHMKPSF